MYFGFSSLFNQWIVANIIAEKIIKFNPEAVLIEGGFGTKKTAIAFLNNFKYFKYAIWGEGEYPLLEFTKYLSKIDTYDNKFKISEIPNIAYNNNEIIKTNAIQNKYVNLNESEFDLTDFFAQHDKANIEDLKKNLQFETGRGCHWKKCHFCFLNKGYKFRLKSVSRIIYEINSTIEKYGITDITFLDNDLIGNDSDRFDKLLDALINLKEKYNTLTIFMAEIVTKNLKYAQIKKMTIAGFTHIQIGYESPSNILLKKINKKNTFASNLFAIKWFYYFRIRIEGLNIIYNLPEETENDIKEGIENLFFMRFFLNNESIKHTFSTLAISESSPYFKKMSNNIFLKEYYYSPTFIYLPQDYIKSSDKYLLCLDFVKTNQNKLWDVFKEIENYYKNNDFEYIILMNDDFIYYREIYNKVQVKELVFNKNESIHWAILEYCNYNCFSIESLKSFFDLSQISTNDSVENILLELKDEGLIYCNDDFTEIITIINTDYIYKMN